MGKICARYCIFVCLFKADRSIGAQHNAVEQMVPLVLILLTCNNCMCYALFNVNIKYALVEANELRCLQHDIGGYMLAIYVKVKVNKYCKHVKFQMFITVSSCYAISQCISNCPVLNTIKTKMLLSCPSSHLY